jgi:hypothetical protein
MDPYVKDPETLWSFNFEEQNNKGGIVIKNVVHDSYNFAKDIRVIGFWMEIETVEESGNATTESQFFSLSAEYFSASKIQVLKPNAVVHPLDEHTFEFLRARDDCLGFSIYFGANSNAFGCGLRADYKSVDKLFSKWPNCDVSRLTISQLFLFSRYGNSPAHEPSGNLPAARFHPMISYTFTPNDKVDRRVKYCRIASIRFDYRMHLYLDPFKEKDSRADPRGNQVGLFRDSDEHVGVGTVIGKGWWRLSADKGVSRAVFKAAEKPAVLEVIVPGLHAGFPFIQKGKERVMAWDNVHWWGAREGEDLPSTPGGFHVAHLHWRWGAAVAGSDRGNEPQFGGPSAGASKHPAYGSAWGPLVDSRAWIQTIFAAAVKYDSKLDPSLAGVELQNLSRSTFNDLFVARPQVDIYKGDDLVLWFSIKVHRESQPFPGTAPSVQDVRQGTVFLHGLFFAHEAESSSKSTGYTGPLHWPKDPDAIRKDKIWVRPAS